MTRSRRTTRALLGVFTVGVAAWLASHAGRLLIVSEPLTVRPDAIVSLASHEWERLPETARVAHAAASAVVLLTQPIAVNEYNCFECATRVDRLVEHGVARERIVVLERKVYRTFDEAHAVRDWMQRSGARSVLAVTSPYHTRRVLTTFRHVLHDVDARVGVHPAWANSPAQPDGWWWRKYDREYVAYETGGLMLYLLRFGVWPV